MPKILEAKKLVSALATSTSMTGTLKKTLKYIFYIFYLVSFKKNTNNNQALVNSEIEIKKIAPADMKILGFQVQKTILGAQKINGSILKTYKIVIAGFQV